MKRIIIILIGVLCMYSCSKDYSKEDVHVASIGTELYIYGGKNSKEFLGKLNASKYDSVSIWNKCGKFGNTYNANCPFNKYGSNPPVLLDKQGKFYGYFTANKYASQRANNQVADIVCENYESIREDVSGWYDRIFR